MRTLGSIVLLVAGIALCDPALCDDAPAKPQARLLDLPLSFAARALVIDGAIRTPPRQSFDAAQPVAWSGTLAGPSVELEFRDPDVIDRLARYRSLSLLTIARFGRARLYVGVNDDGLLGVHFTALTPDDADRSLEVARMPYLALPAR